MPHQGVPDSHPDKVRSHPARRPPRSMPPDSDGANTAPAMILLSAAGDHASAVYAFGPEESGAPFEYLGCIPSQQYVMFHKNVRLG